MNNLNKILYVAERDIDLLLLEDLNVCPDFASWLFTKIVPESEKVPLCKGAWHSVTHPRLGESDLVIKYGNDLAVLIENKVDAPAQPEQAIRYNLRGSEGKNEGLWKKFVTCIIAPERYLRSNTEVTNYDVCVSYEKIRDWFLKQGSKRASYRAYILNEAIEQNRRGYSPVANDDVSEFWQSYWELSNTEFPSLEMPKPGIKPANSDWPDFRPGGLGKELNIVHKMAQGFVDLQVRGAAQNLDSIRSMVNEADCEVVAAGKSAAVRVAVAVVDRFGSFEAQRSRILVALEAAERLRLIGKEIGKGVDKGLRNGI